MRKFLALLLSFASASSCSELYAQSPIIWGPGSSAQMINAGPLVTKDGQTISASGALNLAKNTDAAANLVGIADSGTGTDLTRTVTTSEIPLYPQRLAAIKVAPESSGTGFTRISCFTLPSNGTLDNTKLGVSFYQMMGAGYTAGNLTVDVYSQASSDCSDAGTRLALSTDASAVSALPALTGYFATTFDTTTADYYSVRITRAAGTAGATNWLSFNSVYVGPGTRLQGSVVGEWLSFTPVYSGTLSTSSNVGKYRRVGDSMELEASLTASGTGVGSNFALTIPASLTINTAAVSRTSASYVSLGHGVWFDSSLNDTLMLGATYLSSTTVYFWYNSTTFDTLDNADIETGDEIGFRVTVPIAEWAGTGTVNFGQNDVEYAYNSSTSTSTDTTSFAYGPSGVAIAAFAPSGTTAVKKRVRFQTPVSPTDIVALYVISPTSTSTKLTPVADSTFAYSENDAGTTSYGMWIDSVSGSSTDFDVAFQSKVGPSTAWASVPTYKWVAVKYKPGQAVGFSAATTTSSGLVSTTTQSIAGVKTFSTGLAVDPASTSGNVYSGACTLTHSSNTNMTGTPTFSGCHYIRIGSRVSVAAVMTATITTASGDAVVQISGLPVSSNFTGVTDGSGVGVSRRYALQGRMEATAGTPGTMRITIDAFNSAGVAAEYGLTFIYEIK